MKNGLTGDKKVSNQSSTLRNIGGPVPIWALVYRSLIVTHLHSGATIRLTGNCGSASGRV
jgi:hypothetical protein